jgi:tryptophan synthase alpha chain
LPIAVGFGVRSAAQAKAIGEAADAVVVGSALVEAVQKSLDATGRATATTVGAVTRLVRELADGVASARRADERTPA